MTMPRSKRGKRQKTSFKPLWRAVTYVGHYKNMTLLAYAAIFVSVAAQLMVPQMVQMILDAVTNGMIAQQLANIPSQFLPMALEKLGWTMAQYDQFSNNAETAIFWSAGLIVAFAVARAGFSFAQTFLSQVMSQNVAFDFRNELYAKIQRLSFSYHDRNQTGQLMVRATDDVEKVRRFIGQGMVMALQAVIMLTGTLIILFLTNAKLTLIILPIMPIALFMFMVFGKITQPMFVEVQRRLSRLNAILQENMAGIKVVKAFARNPEEKAKFERSADDYMAQQLKVVRIFSFLFPIVFLVVNLGQAAVLYFGGKQIIYGDLTLGQWQKFSLYLVYVFFPLGQLGFIISQMSQAAASAKRIFDILDARNEVVEKPHAIELSTIEGCVTFDDVTFRYYPEGEPVLSHVSFEAQPGETVALVGPTGAGKTTIINLIPRFYDVSQGAVRIDGIDVRDVTLASLRKQIGIVLQETTLFSGTIKDNIAFGRPDASMDAIIAAAKAAAAHDFIMSFPDGYDTPVGERGTTLSGGQKQRIAIARALLMAPRILILDDATASVDVATEAKIRAALEKLMEGRTSFVIAQRISTVMSADLIIVLEKGRIVAQGQHADLLENSPHYAEIYYSQLVDDVN